MDKITHYVYEIIQTLVRVDIIFNFTQILGMFTPRMIAVTKTIIKIHTKFCLFEARAAFVVCCFKGSGGF